MKEFWKYFTEHVLGEDMCTVLFGLILAGSFMATIVSLAVFISGAVLH